MTATVKQQNEWKKEASVVNQVVYKKKVFLCEDKFTEQLKSNYLILQRILHIDCNDPLLG